MTHIEINKRRSSVGQAVKCGLNIVDMGDENKIII